MNIIFFETQSWEEEYLKERLKGYSLDFSSSANPLQVGVDKGKSEADVICNFVASPVTKETLEKYPKVKYVATRSTGYDHIDVKACREKNILVSNVPTYGENTVAEFTFALILSLSRKMYPSIKRVREQGLFSADGLMGFDLKGKTLGVVGAGHIGMHVVRMAKGFEMHVVAYDPYPKAETSNEFGFEYLSLDDLLKQSDIVTLHVPYLPATHHLINDEKFKLFKKGSILINTARGGLVETESLLKALKSGVISGAAIDVLEEERYIKEDINLLYQKHPSELELKNMLADHELMQMDKVIITPHNAFNSKEAMVRILDTTIANIQAFAAGQPINLVKSPF